MLKKLFSNSKNSITLNSMGSCAIIFLILLSSINVPAAVQALQCIHCSTENDRFCKCNPPEGRECPANYNHCITVKEKDLNNNILTFTRSCSPEDLGNNVCMRATNQDGVEKVLCYTTCSTDNCNKQDLLAHCEEGAVLSDEARAKMEKLKAKLKTGVKDTKDKIDEGLHKLDEKIDNKIDEVKKATGAAFSQWPMHTNTILIIANTLLCLGIKYLL